MVNFVYFSVGNILNHWRLLLSLNSLLHTNSWITQDTAKVIIFTDCISFFENTNLYKEHSSEIIEVKGIEDNTLISMKGKDDFIHRIKICLIKQVLETHKSKVVYLDADTIIMSNLSALVQKISTNYSMMHDQEYLLEDIANINKGDLAGPLFLESYKSMIGSINQVDYSFRSKDRSFNAGVVGIAYENRYLVEDVLQIVDKIYPLCKHFATEQFAFSIVLNRNSTIMTCDSCVYHYWESVKKKIFDECYLRFNTAKFLNNPVLIQREMEGHFNWQSRLLFDAFERSDYLEASRILLWIVVKNPFRGLSFYKDVMYHIKRIFT